MSRGGYNAKADRVVGYMSRSAVGARVDLPGPVGEQNVYFLRPRGRVAALATTGEGLLVQIGAILATGNVAVIEAGNPARSALQNLPEQIEAVIAMVEDWRSDAEVRAILAEGKQDAILALNRAVAALDGPIRQVQATGADAWRRGTDYELNQLLEECSISTNTAAAGGNASLMSIG